MIQVPVEGNFLERWIKGSRNFIDTGRGKVPYKPSKARYNDAIMLK
jgi:hypothetical protein